MAKKMSKTINKSIWARGAKSGNRGFGPNRKRPNTKKCEWIQHG